MGDWFYWGDKNYTGPEAVGKARRHLLARIEATEERLKDYDRRNGTNRFGQYQNDNQARLDQTIRNHKARKAGR